MKDGMITAVLTLEMTKSANLDMADVMRVQMFAMDAEKTAKELPDVKRSEWMDMFVQYIQNTSGFRMLNSFCVIDDDGLKEIASKCFGMMCS